MSGPRLAKLGGVLAVAALAAATSRAAQGAETALPHVDVELRSGVCAPNALIAPSGRVAFTVRNATSVAQEWEILDGVMVIEERENIPPGEARNLTARLTPGDYAITCGLISNPKGSLHVAGRRDETDGVRRAEIVGPLAEYRVFVSNELDALTSAVNRLLAAVEAGRLDEARGLYFEAHAHYARLSPVALYFPDLEGAVDAKLTAHGLDQADPSYLGFNQLGWALFDGDDGALGAGVLRKLSADIAAMQTRFDNLSMTPIPTLAGAAQAIGGASALPEEGGGWRRRLAQSDFEANLEGVRKIADLFLPLVSRGDAALGRDLAEDFSTLSDVSIRLRAGAEAQGRAGDGAAADQRLVKTLTRKLADELSRAPHALGLG